MIQDLVTEKINQFNSIDFLINENSIFEIIMNSHLSPSQKQVYMKLFIKYDIATLIYHFNKVMNNNYHDFLQSITKYICDKENYNYDDILRIISDFTQPIYSYLNSDIVIDFDGNIYKTVKIGTQIWMAENLRVTHDNSGNKIECRYFDQRNLTNGFGLFYGYEALTSDIAPKGWRIPSLNDFEELISYLEINYPSKKNIGKLIASKTLWNKSDVEETVGHDHNSNDITHFNLLPTGYSNSVKNWKEKYESTSLWSSTKKYYNNDVYYFMSVSSGNRGNGIRISYDHAYFGYNIRCIKE